MNIIRAEQEHLAVVAGLFDGYRVFYRQQPDLQAAQTFIQERLDKGDSVIFVALGADTTTGLGFVQLYPLFSSVSMREIWLLNDLYVHPDARRMGVGAALLEHARDFGKATGALRLELATEITNTSAQALYEKLGWVRDVEFYRYSLPLE